MYHCSLSILNHTSYHLLQHCIYRLTTFWYQRKWLVIQTRMQAHRNNDPTQQSNDINETCWRCHPLLVLAMGPGSDRTNGSVRFQNRPNTRPTVSWGAKPGLVPVNPWVLPGLDRPVGANLRFCVSGFSIYGRI